MLSLVRKNLHQSYLTFNMYAIEQLKKKKVHPQANSVFFCLFVFVFLLLREYVFSLSGCLGLTHKLSSLSPHFAISLVEQSG